MQRSTQYKDYTHFKSAMLNTNQHRLCIIIAKLMIDDLTLTLIPYTVQKERRTKRKMEISNTLEYFKFTF